MPPKRSTRESTRTSKPATSEKVTATKKATAANSKQANTKAPAAPKKSAVKATGSGKQSRSKDAPSKSARKLQNSATPTASASAKKRKAEAVEVEPTEAKPTREPKKARVTKPLPTPVPKPKVVINHAPTTKLNVYVCGEGSSGELGLGTAKTAVDVKRPRLNPLLAADEVGVVQVAVGGMHCVALTHDNKILTWGVNDQGALGRNTAWEGGYKDIDENKSDSDSDDDDSALNPLESNPTAIPSESFPSGTVFVEVAAGDSSSFALTDDGLVYGWGTFRVR